jgi:hypothetical protein
MQFTQLTGLFSADRLGCLLNLRCLLGRSGGVRIEWPFRPSLTAFSRKWRWVAKTSVNGQIDGPRAIALAYQWVARITGVCIQMVAPGLIGLWLDRRIGSVVVFTMLGFVVGITLGVWQLVRMTSDAKDDCDSS